MIQPSLYIFLILLISLLGKARLHADQIVLKNGNIINGKLKFVSPESLGYLQNKTFPVIITIPRTEVKKIIYDDGTIVNFSDDVTKNLYENKLSLDESENTEAFLLPVPLRISLINLRWDTKVILYDLEDKAVADGKAVFNQSMIKLSTEGPPSLKSFFDYYITPEIGYFYRTIKVKDYAYSVDKLNSNREGFIPGIITDPNTGEKISKDTVSSLAYNANFHSYFLELKGGFHLSFGSSGVYFNINPYLSVNAFEFRKSIFEFTFSNNTETFTNPYKLTYLSSFGYGLKFEFFFPKHRFGISIGYDKKYLKRFALPSDIRFKGVYLDETLGIMRTQENSAKYTNIGAGLFIVDAYIIF